MMSDKNWFQKKWGTPKVPIDILLDRVEELEERVNVLEQKYQGALMDIKRLEEENIETSNLFYELIENIRAVDARIDIVAEYCGVNQDV
jgi:archaellum component FlaC